MSKSNFKKKNEWGLGSVHPAVLAVWAALIAVAHMLPSIPMVGTGSTFSVSSALIPLAGIFFGPIPGALCVAIGNFIGQIIAPHIAWLGLATFIIGTFNGLGAGLISRGKWYIVLIIMAICTALYYSTEIGRGAPMLPIVFYGLGAIATIIGGIFGRKWLTSNNYALKVAAVFFCAYGGFVTSSCVANLASIYILKLPSTLWAALTFVSPVERTVFAIGSCIVGVPLLIGLPKIGIFIGPQPDEEDFGEAA